MVEPGPPGGDRDGQVEGGPGLAGLLLGGEHPVGVGRPQPLDEPAGLPRRGDPGGDLPEGADGQLGRRQGRAADPAGAWAEVDDLPTGGSSSGPVGRGMPSRSRWSPLTPYRPDPAAAARQGRAPPGHARPVWSAGSDSPSSQIEDTSFVTDDLLIGDPLDQVPAPQRQPEAAAPPAGGTTAARGRLVRRTDNKVIAGVASGIADALGIQPILVRIAFVVLIAAGGLGVWLYVLGWLLLPPHHPHAVQLAVLWVVALLWAAGIAGGWTPWAGSARLRSAALGDQVGVAPGGRRRRHRALAGRPPPLAPANPPRPAWAPRRCRARRTDRGLGLRAPCWPWGWRPSSGCWPPGSWSPAPARPAPARRDAGIA